MKQKVEPLTLGVDLGGTKLKVGVIDAKGEIISSHNHPTNLMKGPEEVISDIVTCVRDCLGGQSKEAKALGIGIAAQVDAADGAVRFAPNLGWKDVPLKAQLEKALSLPVVVTNDVRAATIGEWFYGAGKGVSDLVCIFVGTGIGGGVVSGGCLLKGSSNTAGELGHMTIVVNGRQCHCPNRGCLEAYAGGWAIAERAREAVSGNPLSGKTLINIAGSIEAITATTVTLAYRMKDPLACELVDETAHYLASGITGIVNAFNPHLVILGGGVIEGLPELISMVEERVKGNALKAATATLKIVKSLLGSNAGIIGASTLAQSKIKERFL